MRDFNNGNSDRATKLFDDLESSLRTQINLARRNKIREAETMADRVSVLSAEIAKSGVLEKSEFINRANQLKQLNTELCLIVAAEKASTAEQLSRIRRYRKVLGTYGNSI